ncbi:serine/threonine protein phosphatase 1 [Rhizobium sp. PP-CC-2G-626]|nr:serine/threonine protein phosphatase 1 [Rhizobium sp. PP-CC-2G-626]
MLHQHTFALGDIHGRADLLGQVLRLIDARAEERELDPRIVFLGDVIDRGPDSREAMDMVADSLVSNQASRLILGNHDWFPIRILEELQGERQFAALEHWKWRMGGSATLASYGFDPEGVSPCDLEARFPSRHLDMLRNASRYVELPRHVLVHAGLAPGIPLAEQTAYDLMWIREPFLSHDGSLGKTVVHGHSVTRSGRCEVLGNRIGIDTGAHEPGRLSVVHIEPSGSVGFLGTEPGRAPGVIEFISLGRRPSQPPSSTAAAQG